MELSNLIIHLIFGMLIFMTSLMLTKWVLKLNIVDEPNQRSSHEVPTPRSGGIAVTTSFTIGIILFYFLADWSRIAEGKFIAFIAAFLLIAFISFFDDKKGLGFKIKLGWQFVSSLILIFSGIVFERVDLPFEVPSFFLTLLTLGWLIFFMNAFNFMDGLNGLAGGTTMIACLFLMFIGLQVGASFVYVSALILFFSTAGFFLFNFPKAQIFLGDTGSQFIALVLAILGIIGSGHDQGVMSIFTVPLLFYIFIFDVSFTIVRRALGGKNIFSAHRSHLYQILNRAGISHVVVSLIQFFHIIIGGVCALYVNFYGGNPFYMVGLVALIFVLYAFCTYLYGRNRITLSTF